MMGLFEDNSQHWLDNSITRLETAISSLAVSAKPGWQLNHSSNLVESSFS
jgi:hypothetical protein